MSAVAATAGLLLLGMAARPPAAFAAQAPVGLGTATSFAVLAGTTVTNTGPSIISGDLGVSPGTAITGFPPGTVISGTQHAADAVALQAQTDLTTAYNDAAGRTPPIAVPSDLGGLTLVPGVYNAASALSLTGTVTLDAQGDPTAVFIFQAGSTLITASSSTVALIGGAQACNVFWQVGSSATLGTDTTFVGSILALTSISVQTRTTVAGRVLARNGQVSLDNNRITRPRCAPTLPTPTTVSPTASPTVSPTASPTVSPTASPTVSPTATATVSPTATATASPTVSPTATATVSPTATATATATATPVPTTTAPPVGGGVGGPGDVGGTGAPGDVVPGGDSGGSGVGGAGSDVIPSGAPDTGAGGATRTGHSPLTGLGGLALVGAAAALVQAIRRRAAAG